VGGGLWVKRGLRWATNLLGFCVGISIIISAKELVFQLRLV
jgi:hypothetical protein